MLIKNKQEKMPFIPNFGIIFLIEAVVLFISLYTQYIYFPVWMGVWIFLTSILYAIYFRKYERLWYEYLFLNDQPNSETIFEKQKNILKILSYIHTKMPYFPIPYWQELSILEEKIKSFLKMHRNESYALESIADSIYRNKDFEIWKIPIHSLWNEDIFREFLTKRLQQRSFVYTIFCIILLNIGIILAIITASYVLLLSITPVIIIVFNKYNSSRQNLYEHYMLTKENSWEYKKLLQYSVFYESKLGDFYDLVFHKNNFLPETPLLFADIITLISQNITIRKKFLQKYRYFWKWRLGYFGIIPNTIPENVEIMIANAEQNIVNEIANLKEKIREWAEFEKQKIETVSNENKKFFQNPELTSKRQEILIQNLNLLTK